MEENRIFQEQPTQLATIDGKTPLDKEGIRTACSAILGDPRKFRVNDNPRQYD